MATVALGLLLVGRHGLGPGGAPAAVLRDVALRPPLHLSRDRARVRAPVRDRRGLHRSARARAVVGVLYIAVAALLLWYRVCVPLRAAFRHRLRVARVVRENRRTSSRSTWPGDASTSLGAESGQFFRWRFLTRDLWWAANPYSLSAAPAHGQLRITVKVTGRHSAALQAAAARHAGARRRAVRLVHRGSPAQAARRAHRRRHRHHSAARTVRVAAGQSRRDHPRLPRVERRRPRAAPRDRRDRRRARRTTCTTSSDGGAAARIEPLSRQRARAADAVAA